MALAVSAWRDSRAGSARIHASRAVTSGLFRSLRPACHWSGLAPLFSCSTGQDMTADQVDERCQRGAARSNPVGQGGHVQLDAFAGVDVTLPIERLVLAEFGIEDHRQ